MRIPFSILKNDKRILALIILIPLTILASAGIALGYDIFSVVLLLGAGALLLFLRYPEMSMAVLFPLMWLFWSYNAPWLGGRLERGIGVLAIVGVAFALLSRRRTLVALPGMVVVGLTLLFGSYFISGVINFTPGFQANIISLAMRLLFLYLAYFHLHTSRQLRLAAILLIFTGLIGAVIILYWNLEWGLGFFRTYEGQLKVLLSLGPFWYSLLTGGNSLTIPAALLIGFSSVTQNKHLRYLVLFGAIFLFVMAFIAQFRREILITASLLLVYIFVTNLNGLRKSAMLILLGLGIFYVLALQPSAIFQERIGETAMVLAGTDPRLLSLEGGLQAFLQAPILGTGPASYESSAFRQMGPNYPSFYYHAYNVFIYFAVESGILGLGGLLLTLYAVIREIAHSQVDKNTPQGWILRSAPMLMIVTLISFLFGNQVEMSLPWYVMGLILSASYLAEENKQRL